MDLSSDTDVRRLRATKGRKRKLDTVTDSLNLPRPCIRLTPKKSWNQVSMKSSVTFSSEREYCGPLVSKHGAKVSNIDNQARSSTAKRNSLANFVTDEFKNELKPKNRSNSNVACKKKSQPLAHSSAAKYTKSKTKASRVGNQPCSSAGQKSALANFVANEFKEEMSRCTSNVTCKKKSQPDVHSSVGKNTKVKESGGWKQPCLSAAKKASFTHFVAMESTKEPKLKSKCPSEITRKRKSKKVAKSPAGKQTKSKKMCKRLVRKKHQTSKFSEEKARMSSDNATCNSINQSSKYVPTLPFENNRFVNNSLRSSSLCDEYCFPKFSHCRQITDPDSRLSTSRSLSTLNINDTVDKDIPVPTWTGFMGLLDNTVSVQNRKVDLSKISRNTEQDVSVPRWTGVMGLLDNSVPVKDGRFDFSAHFLETGGKDSKESWYDSESANIPDDFMWTDKYENEIFNTIRDNPSVLELREWLLEWKSKLSGKSGEFKTTELSDSSGSEDDVLQNCVLIAGQLGCGKTSMVLSLATELGYKVLEVNGSSCRSGRHIQSHLREAFQSYHVDASSCTSLSSLRIDAFIKEDVAGDSSKRSRKTKTMTRKDIRSFFGGRNSQVSNDVPKAVVKQSTDGKSPCIRNPVNAENPSKLSMILFDDVDVVLEEDDGFWRTVNSFLKTTRKPVVLTAGRNLNSVVSQLATPYKLINMENPGTNEVVKILKLPYREKFCIDLEFLSVYNSTDIRRCLLSLQFWSKHTVGQNFKYRNINSFCSIDAMQNSNSLADLRNAVFSETPLTILNGIVDHLLLGFDLLHDNLFACLFNLHGLPRSSKLGYPVPRNSSQMYYDKTSESKNKGCVNIKPEESACVPHEDHTNELSSKCAIKILSDFSTILEIFSFTDCIKGERKGNSSCLLQASERIKQWSSGIPVCVDQNFSSTKEFIIEITSVINILSVNQAKHMTEISCSPSRNSMTTQEQARLQFCSHNLRNYEKLIRSVTSVIPLTQQLNSRAVVLDYTSALKAICSLEAVRKSSNLKRCRRFLHYFDSISMFCNPSDFL